MFKDYIPEAFPHGRDLILDSEVLLIDAKTGKPLPFGSLGIHKVISNSSISGHEMFLCMCTISLTLRRRIKSHLLFAGIIRSSPFSPR